MKTKMQLKLHPILTCLSIFPAVVFSSPTVAPIKAKDATQEGAVIPQNTPLNETAVKQLQARGGWRTATAYSGTSCLGTNIGSVSIFGCGGTCWSSNTDIWSIKLVQQNTAIPNPSANLYASSDCSGSRLARAGIWDWDLEGCTTLPSAARSFYLYYNC